MLKLKKALYGTKQAANAWQKFLTKILLGLGGKRHLKDECVFIFRAEDGGWLFMSTHVDDIFPLFNEKGRKIKDKVLAALENEVVVESKGEVSWALSTKIERDAAAGILKISQHEDISRLIEETGLEAAAGEETPSFYSGGDVQITDADLPKTEEERKRWMLSPFAPT